MRLLTNSPFNPKGLISINEAPEEAPQKVIFCIPLESYEAERIRDLDDFRNFFRQGISTKMNDSGKIKKINLDFHSSSIYINNREIRIPNFTATTNGLNVDFYLSHLNFRDHNILNTLDFDFYYDGRISDDLVNKKFVILEPNWMQLDRLFIEKRILFADWN